MLWSRWATQMEGVCYIDVKEIQSLIDMFESTTLTELELERGDSRLVLKREPAPTQFVSEFVPAPTPQHQATPAPAPHTAASTPEPTSEDGSTAQVDAIEGFAIEAPIVGTFFRRPAPEEDPYVEVGDRVNPGDTVCIVEAMKVMNEVRTERAGIVKEILLDDSTPVEYGQPLIILDTFDN